MTTPRALHDHLRLVVAAEIERVLPVELWTVNEFGADVVIPVERLAREIGQAVADRFDITAEVHHRVAPPAPERRSRLTSRRPLR